MTVFSRVLISAAAVVLLLGTPSALHACPVCFDPNDESRIAFLATAIFLTLLPLGMVSSAVLWVRRRVRRMEAEELELERD